ncbi:MAG: 4'-phosphopantetheinyl transferase superfamily protein [Acidimicrobiales bacterium]
MQEAVAASQRLLGDIRTAWIHETECGIECRMVGIDLVFIPEFRERLEVSAGKLMQKAFSPSEINGHQLEHLAGLWAAKEAVVKAAATAPDKWTDIVISHDASGKPHARIGAQEFAVSISHHGDYAVAVAYRMGT